MTTFPELTEAEVHANILATATAADTAHAATEQVRQTMFDLVEQIIDWCENASAYLFTGGQHGSFDPMVVATLMQHGETALLASKALAVRTDALADQERWLAQRTDQVSLLLGLAAVMG